MPKVRVPGWWLVVGGGEGGQVSRLFAEVMQALPMSQAELAQQLGVDQTTVARWAAGKSTPTPETMLETVERVRAELESRLQRTSLAEQVLGHVVAAVEAASASGRFDAGSDHAKALRKLLPPQEE